MLEVDAPGAWHGSNSHAVSPFSFSQLQLSPADARVQTEQVHPHRQYEEDMHQASGPTMRRGTSEISLSSLEKQPGGKRSISYTDVAQKSLQMLCGNPDGSHIEGARMHVKLDLTVGISCLAFGLLAVLYAVLEEPLISAIIQLFPWSCAFDACFSLMRSYLETCCICVPYPELLQFNDGLIYAQVTVTSTLSDAVVHGCTPLDVLDRYVATASAGAIAWYSFQWMRDGPSIFWLVAIPVQTVQLLVPLYFLAKSRALQIGSEEWRHAHACWHWAAVSCAATASLMSHFCWSAAAPL